MRKLIVLAIAILGLVSCHKTPQPSELPPQDIYLGTVSVDYEGGVVDNPDIQVAFLPSEDGTSADIIIYKIKFVPKMPVRIDVTIPGVALAEEPGGYSFSCDNVVPLALGGEYPKYTVTALSGTLEGGNLSFGLNFGAYPTRFNGTRHARL